RRNVRTGAGRSAGDEVERAGGADHGARPGRSAARARGRDAEAPRHGAQRAVPRRGAGDLRLAGGGGEPAHRRGSGAAARGAALRRTRRRRGRMKRFYWLLAAVLLGGLAWIWIGSKSSGAGTEWVDEMEVGETQADGQFARYVRGDGMAHE